MQRGKTEDIILFSYPQKKEKITAISPYSMEKMIKKFSFPIYLFPK